MEIRDLREWNPLPELHAQIPLRVQRNLFLQDLSITCVQVLEEFVILGSDAGIVFWFNRSKGEMQRLHTETLSSVTCLHVVSSVEYIVASGSACGQINVFQIQKEIPPDLKLDIPLTRTRPIERYTIKNMHSRHPVQCVHLSKNGMRLFSGDQSGSVVMTEFDYQLHISKSVEILNESYEIVQMDFRQPWLLVSTIYRSIVAELQSDGKWKVSQIGIKDRKVLSDFGVSFIGTGRTPSILCVRPGFRVWISDTSGNVQKTILFKDSMARINQSAFEVPLLNPGQPHVKPPVNFGLCYMLDENILVSIGSDCMYFLHLDQQKVVASVRRLRSIRSVCVRDGEIFVLEGVRNIVRLSHLPGTGHIEFASLTAMNESAEFRDGDENLLAEECFELPPIEAIHLNTPLKISLDEHDLLLQDKLFLEHSRRVEVFERINEVAYDDSILFKQSKTKKKSLVPQIKRYVPSGIVEIGQQAVLPEEQIKKTKFVAPTSKNTFEASGRNDSVCTEKLSVPKAPIDDPSPAINLPSVELKNPSIAPPYPMRFWKEEPQHTTPLKKRYFIQDNEQSHAQNSYPLDSLIQPQYPTTSAAPSAPADNPETISSVPDVRAASDYMNIPNLWNVEIECDDDAVAEAVDIDEASSFTSDTSFEIVDL